MVSGDQVLEMSNAAISYHKAVKENRNLYNMVQDLKGPSELYCIVSMIRFEKGKNRKI